MAGVGVWPAMHYLAPMQDIRASDFFAENARSRDPRAVGMQPLVDELDCWSAAHWTLDVWWRDDDVGAPSPALDRLLGAAERSGAPLALAAIPAGIDDALGPKLDDRLFTVLQHGYGHRNFAAPGERAVECGGDRPLDEVLASLVQGQKRLASLFGGRFVPVMVPPWNRIDPVIAARLPDLGYRALSVFGEKAGGEAESVAGLPQLNAHLDLLTWKGGARFAGRAKLIELASERIAMRRRGVAVKTNGRAPSPSPEPFGILTHHLDHDEETWDFLDELLGLLSAHPAVRLASVRELLA